jgi:uncharacterized membrane protein YoaK (UPF0700 family)
LSEAGRLRLLLTRPADRDGPLVPLLFTLTFLTGLVDAASYLKLGHVFVANMTGNVVFLGFALAGAGGLSVASALIALASFLLGARVGGHLGTQLAGHRGRLLRAGTTLQATLVVIAALLALAVGAAEPEGVRYAITALLAVAMGIQNSAAQRLAVPELTTTVLTRTLTGLAADSASPAAHAGLFRRRLGAVAAMLLGALAGALLALEVSVAAGLGLAGATAIGVAVAAHLVSRGQPEWARP